MLLDAERRKLIVLIKKIFKKLTKKKTHGMYMKLKQGKNINPRKLPTGNTGPNQDNNREQDEPARSVSRRGV